MKNLILLLLLSTSISGKSQTFIGKTQEEIKKLNSGNEPIRAGSVDTLFTTMTFADNKRPVIHDFTFNKDKVCVAYSISTKDKAVKETIQKEIEKKAFDKLTERSWVEKIEGKIYGWQLQDTYNLFVFTSTQIKQ